MEAGRLQLNPHHGLRPQWVGTGIDVTDGDVTSIGPQQAFDGAESAGLAGAVRTQQPEDLTLVNVESNAIDGQRWAVAHAQVLDLERQRRRLRAIHRSNPSPDPVGRTGTDR